MPEVNLKKPEQHIGTVQIPEQPTKPVSQLFREAAVTIMARSAILATTFSCGVLPSPVPITPGAGTWAAISAK